MPKDEVFLKLEGIKKSFGGVKALKGVNLEIKGGEVHCLAGQNGCGKSTLIKIISGVYQHDAGNMFVEGKNIEKQQPIDAIRNGVQVIYQDFAVFPNLSVAENIGLNRVLMNGEKTINWKRTKKMAVEAMGKIGISLDPDILLERLSVANKQIVAICRAIFNKAKFIILDEPTTALTAKEVDMLFGIVRNLKEQGIAIMIVNHKIDEIFAIADKLTVIRNGEYISSGDISEYDKDRIVRDLTGKDIQEIKYSHTPDKNDVVFSVKNLTRTGVFEDVSFDIYRGDVFGITGLLGSGRGEIADAIFGVSPADSGTITLNGEDIRIKSIDDAMTNKIAYVPEDRLTQGLFLTRSILDNTMVASLKKYFAGMSLDNAKMLEDTNKWIEDIAVKTPSAEPPINTLSGGNQQKVVIAKWLNTNPKLLILNGPTVGVDIGSKTEIHTIVRELAKEGVAVIVISDDLPELITNCNRMIVVRHGKVVGEFDNSIDETALAGVLNEN